MSLFIRDAQGRLIPVNPGLARHKGNQGGMGRTITEADVMSRLPDADIVGAIGPGVVPGGEQSVGARRADLAQENASPPAPTYRPLSGAQQNNRGNVQIVTMGTLSGSPIQNIASVVETSKSNGDDAEAITIQLGLEIPSQVLDPNGLYTAAIPNVTAIIEWGVGGAFFTAEVDWNLGVSFPIVASYVRVSARIAAQTPILVPDYQFVLKASLGYGAAQSINQSSSARRTVPVASPVLGAGVTSALIAVPAWAMGFTIVDSGAVGGAGFPEPDYLITVGVAAYRHVTRTNQGRQVEGQYPIPAGAQFIQVKNNLGVGMVQPTLIFNLGF